MSSLTIEELKKTLTENGIDLPTGRTKKEDYVKLYEEHLALNSSLGNSYSSDEESSQNSRKVTSTNGNDSSGVFDAVANLSNNDLFEKLKELGYNAGPVIENTRKVYEKKLIQLLRGEQTNGHSNSVDSVIHVDPSEISDNEVELVSRGHSNRRSIERNATPQPSSSKRGASREPSVQESRPAPEPAIPRRISYIEKIPRGSSERIIEPISTYNVSSDLRHRSQGASEDVYVGRWSPNTSRFNVQPLHKEQKEKPSKKNLLLFAVAAVVIIAVFVVVYNQWSATDPYKLIEDDVEKEVKEFTARKADP